PDFALSQPRLHFACHIRNVTPKAVSIPIEVGKLEAQDRFTDAEYDAFRDHNRRRTPVTPEPPYFPPSPSKWAPAPIGADRAYYHRPREADGDADDDELVSERIRPAPPKSKKTGPTIDADFKRAEPPKQTSGPSPRQGLPNERK